VVGRRSSTAAITSATAWAVDFGGVTRSEVHQEGFECGAKVGWQLSHLGEGLMHLMVGDHGEQSSTVLDDLVREVEQ
jgi:hypothetical protein